MAMLNNQMVTSIVSTPKKMEMWSTTVLVGSDVCIFWGVLWHKHGWKIKSPTVRRPIKHGLPRTHDRLMTPAGGSNYRHKIRYLPQES